MCMNSDIHLFVLTMWTDTSMLDFEATQAYQNQTRLPRSYFRIPK